MFPVHIPVRDVSRTSLSSFFKAVVHLLTINPHPNFDSALSSSSSRHFKQGQGQLRLPIGVPLSSPLWRAMGRQVLKQQGVTNWNLADFHLATYAGCQCQRWRLCDPGKGQLFTSTQSMELTKGDGKHVGQNSILSLYGGKQILTLTVGYGFVLYV